ncbi:MAG: uncharacterized membrane protein (DUF106 family) [Candidatus Woesearchaeota archaeon]|jgi:uncharacterized membrane protein (DUF106 family)
MLEGLVRILDPIFVPLLKLGAFWTVVILSAVAALLINIVQKLVTDQHLMKELRSQMKKLQAKAKTLKDQPDKMMAVQGDIMKKNFAYMKESFKATFITMIPLLLVFAWLPLHVAYEPIAAGEDFSVSAFVKKNVAGDVLLVISDGLTLVSPESQTVSKDNREATWTLNGPVGEHTVSYSYLDETINQSLTISDGREYARAEIRAKDSYFDRVKVGYEKNVLLDLGFFQGGWIVTYILFSIIFSLSFKKLLGLH